MSHAKILEVLWGCVAPLGISGAAGDFGVCSGLGGDDGCGVAS